MNFLKIAEYVEENGLTIGIRGLCEDEEYKVGDTARESYEWDFENDCSTYVTDGEEGLKTGGTSCLMIGNDMDDVEELAANIEKSFDDIKDYGYPGKGFALLVSKHPNNDGAFDPGETRLEDAEVIAIMDDDFNTIDSI